MAEDEETATTRYIVGNVSIVSTIADDPDKYRAGLKKKLLELAILCPWPR